MERGIFQLPAWINLIEVVDEQHIQKSAKLIDVTYCHVWKIIAFFISIGLVEKTKNGRNSKIILNEDGKRLKELIIEMKKILSKYQK